jgi:hypothetical protein
MDRFVLFTMLFTLLIVVVILNLMIDRVVWKSKVGARRNMRDPKLQLDAAANVGFQRQKLMNKGEYRVFATIESLLARRGARYRLMAQVNLGEILQPDPNAPELARQEAFAAIASKRVDLLVIDRTGEAVLTIEVQGSGHYIGKTAFLRDTVKREALRRAGVEMLEIMPTQPTTEIEAQVIKMLDAAGASQRRAA